MSDSTPAGEVSESDAILLSAYLDGELSEQERAELEKRLAQEPALQAELVNLKADGKLLKALDPADSQTTAGFKAFRNTLATAAPSEIPTAPALPTPRFRRFIFISACLFFALLIPAAFKRVATQKRSETVSAWRLEKLSGRGHVERDGRVYDIFEGEWLHRSDVLLLEPNGREDGTATLRGPHNAEVSVEIEAKSSPVLSIGADNSVRLEDGRFVVELPGEQAAHAVKIGTPDGTVAPQGKGPWKLELAVSRAKKP